MNESTFSVLNAVNCNGHTEKKNGLTYLSWAWAWAEVKKRFPDATYTVYERADGRIYWDDGRTAWVKTGVSIGGLEHIEYLPVMDFRNSSIPVEKITSMDVNKTVQRSLTKACARHGLGLYIYAGEDLPEEDADGKAPVQPAVKPPLPEPPGGLADAAAEIESATDTAALSAAWRKWKPFYGDNPDIVEIVKNHPANVRRRQTR